MVAGCRVTDRREGVLLRRLVVVGRGKVLVKGRRRGVILGEA